MTRRTLQRTLRRMYLLLGLLLALSFVSMVLGDAPIFGAASFKHIYEYLKDMSLLIATGGVAYISNVFQKRHAFVESLQEEWRDILKAKSAIFAFSHIERPSHAQFVEAFCVVSETIDNMRVVYRNVGETDELIGLYPYAPLHDMRRALQSLNPLDRAETSYEERKQVRDAMLQAFYALRERFLDELDLEEPSNPLLIMAARRGKRAGAIERARSAQADQQRRQDQRAASDPEVDALLLALYEKERGKEADARRNATAL